MRQIIIDENNAITGFCEGDGYVEGGIDVKYYPDNFVEEFAPEKWLYIDGEYMLNSNYVEPSDESTDEPTSDEPSAEELLDIFLGVDE